MKTLIFEIEIQSNVEKIWKSLWDKDYYTQWTKPFTEGCYYETTTFSEGNHIKFLSPSGDGMLSKIVSLKPQEFVAFEHLGMIMNGKESSFKAENDNHQYLETYHLLQNENTVILTVKVDTLEPWEDMMNQSFPKALQIVKELSEN